MLFCFVFYIMQIAKWTVTTMAVNPHLWTGNVSVLFWKATCLISYYGPPTSDYWKCCTCVWFLQCVLRPCALLCWLIFVSTVLILFWALSLRMFPVSLLVYVLLSCCLLIFFVLLLLYFLLFFWAQFFFLWTSSHLWLFHVDPLNI